MGFISKTKEFVTGKSELERKQEAAANAVIRKEVLAAQYQERRIQAVKFAAEKEKVAYEKRTKQLRQPKPSFFSGSQSNTFGNMFGSSQPVAQAPVRRIVRKRKVRVRYSRPVKRRRKYYPQPIRRKRRKTKRVQQKTIQPKRYDLLGGFGS